MKERRKKGGRPPAHSELTTRRPRERVQPVPQARPARAAPDEELLRALRAWAAGKTSGERSADDALSTASKDGRWRLKGALDRVFRHYARLSWLIERQGAAPTPDLVWGAASAILDGAPLEDVARRIAVTSTDISRLAGLLGRAGKNGIDDPAMPNPVRAECPDEFYQLLSDSFGSSFTSEVSALNQPAPLDVRVNTLKSDTAALTAALSASGAELRPVPLAPHGLRARGRPDLAATAAFTAGQFDMQDEGSQIVAALADARPGLQVVDFCAGAGGKSLALAAAMQNRGHLVAADTSAKRLARAKLRMKRAGVENAERVLLTGTDSDPFLKRKAGQIDRVLVDAPCSGTGAWRRHPEAKWGAGIDLARLTALQDAVLARAARLVKRGGRLTYATCSVLPEENEARATAFLAAHPGFRRMDLAAIWKALLAPPYPDTGSDALQLTPFRHGTDGFFVTVFERIA